MSQTSHFDDSYNSIREATYGIAFSGTPHQRGNFAKLGDIASSITRGVLRKPSNTFINALKRDSLFSNTLVRDFRHQLEDYYVLSFFETLSMRRSGLVRTKACIPDRYRNPVQGSSEQSLCYIVVHLITQCCKRVLLAHTLLSPFLPP